MSMPDGMEKRNVAEENRTPEPELKREDENWDKTAAALFVAPKPEMPKVNGEVQR